MSKLWYKQQANIWEEALPLGNGRLGAMVFGNPKNERIQVNEESIWYGGSVNRNNPNMKENLPKIRELIFNGEISKAESLMMAAMSGCPNSQHPYQTLGDLYLDQKGLGEITEYYRELDLNTAVCKVAFLSDGIAYTREIFVSKPAECMVMRITADKQSSISLSIGMGREKYFDGIKPQGQDGLYLYGNLGRGSSEFAMKVSAQSKGGKVYTIGEHLCVDYADEVLLFFTADTTYQCSREEKQSALEAFMKCEFDASDIMNLDNKSDYELAEIKMQQGLRNLLCKRMDERIAAAKEKGYQTLLAEHVEDYKALYDRMSFELEGVQEFDAIPTDERIENAAKDKPDAGLSKMYFDYGRYLLIACSRPGGLPATLQGLWNKDMMPPWDAKYTININTEMNYWPAENCNLSECHMPLFDLVEKMVKNGRKTAREMYGCRGFVAHHNTDINGDTAPQDLWIPGTYWVMGAAWLCTHQWTHFQYTQDVEFLKKTFPIMCEAALFFLDFLVEKDGYLVTCPSVSPENTYILPSGEMGANGAGVTMDNQILRDLFTQCMEAYAVLQEQAALDNTVAKKLKEAEIEDIKSFIKQVEETCNRLIPTRIGERGTILEWQEDYKEWEPGHRHISHLYGLHPSEQITMDETPQLAQAARKTLEFRLANGGGHTGWSRAWIINHYAKLWDAETAYYHIEQLFAHSTYPNMFDKHPPFQIDGNFGATAAMAEMILQSRSNRLILLPALPVEWEKGSMKGLRIKGNAYADISWEKGKLLECCIYARSDLKTQVRYGENNLSIELAAGESIVLTESSFL